MRLLNALILSLSFGLVQCSILLPRDDPLQQLSLSSDADSYKIPSVHESAIMARRILRLESIGTTSTVFPHDTSNLHGAPAGIEGQPIGLMEYFADCETSTGNPTLLAVAIATSFKNVAAGSNITLSVRYHAPKSARMTPAALPRFSLMGHLEDIRDVDVEKGDITKCYRTYHPDAFWTPERILAGFPWMCGRT
ncbi:hypothetical protein FH972_021531 [Carpinus fangiana]|uniref:CREG-like beta-barrel domain-containing protein n=1 Tax=Carpinus fangiana TaxID=176857 RepID=A0A5N6KQ64_9ROSI|nr:hypothetical protein FH972_021531 [Carpinus fangiana]